MTRTISHLTRSALLGAVLLAAGCTTVGPNYPGAPQVATQATGRGTFLRSGDAATPAARAARWWEALGDPVLSGLIDDALAGSPNVAMASARIEQARAGLAASRTAMLPAVGASFSAPYVNVPGGLLSTDGPSGGRDDLKAYSLGFDASWELDLFGGTRRKVEAASARADAAQAGLADAQVALSAEVARGYVALRARQAVVSVLERQLGIDDDLVALAAQRFKAGTAPEQPLAQLRAQRAQTEGDLARGRADALVLTDQLAVLTGREPGALDAMLAKPAAVPAPPASIAIGDPAAMLRARPDIRIAERQLAAANADVGVEVANKFPAISFIGLLGLGGANVGDMFDPSSLIGLALPRLTWSLFDGGRANAQVRSAKGAHAEAEAKYRAAVLSALQDAEGSLTRFGGQRIALGKALEAERQSARLAALEGQRATGGTASRSDALAAERQALAAQLGSISAKADLASSFIAVEKSLGLGWTVP